MNKQQYLHWHGWIERHAEFGKKVTCIRCTKEYSLGERQELIDSPGCYWKDNKCPHCGCKLYIS